jgi:glutathione S-transferase
MDRHGVSYQEAPHGPPFLFLVTAWYGGAMLYPLFYSQTAKLFTPATIIEYLDWCAPDDSKLIPGDRAGLEEYRRLRDYYYDDFGAAAARLAYFYLLPRADLMKPVLTRGAPWIESVLTGWFYSNIAKSLTDGLGIQADGVPKDLEKVRAGFGLVENRLSDGRRYLGGDRFSIHDVNFASMAAPLVVPENYGASFPPIDQLPAEFGAVVKELQARPAGLFVHRLYREERIAKKAP